MSSEEAEKLVMCFGLSLKLSDHESQGCHFQPYLSSQVLRTKELWVQGFLETRGPRSRSLSPRTEECVLAPGSSAAPPLPCGIMKHLVD